MRQPYRNMTDPAAKPLDSWDQEIPHDAPITSVGRQRQTFVAPARDTDIVRHVEAYPTPAAWPIVTQETPGAQSITTGSHQDRAHAFSHVTGRLALTMGALGVVVGIVGFHVPIVSVAVLAWFGTCYAVVWLIAYCIYAFVSAEGAAFMHVRSGWGYLRREQRHRHEMERHANGMGRRGRR